jgi:hypothetical protein
MMSYTWIAVRLSRYTLTQYLTDWLPDWLTNEQGFLWEDNSCSASQEMFSLLWNLKFLYCVHYMPLVLVLSQKITWVHSLQLCFAKINFDINLLFTLRSSKRSHTSAFPVKHYLIFWSFHVCCIPSQSHPSWCDCSSNVQWRVQITKLSRCS